MAPGLRAATLEAKVAEHPAGRRAAGLREDAASLPAALARAAREQAMPLSQRKFALPQCWGTRCNGSRQAGADTIWAQAMRLEEEATAEILGRAKVVATTCIGAGDPRLAGLPFRLCALDEATQVRLQQRRLSSVITALPIGSCSAAGLRPLFWKVWSAGAGDRAGGADTPPAAVQERSAGRRPVPAAADRGLKAGGPVLPVFTRRTALKQPITSKPRICLVAMHSSELQQTHSEAACPLRSPDEALTFAGGGGWPGAEPL